MKSKTWAWNRLITIEMWTWAQQSEVRLCNWYVYIVTLALMYHRSKLSIYGLTFSLRVCAKGPLKWLSWWKVCLMSVFNEKPITVWYKGNDHQAIISDVNILTCQYSQPNVSTYHHHSAIHPQGVLFFFLSSDLLDPDQRVVEFWVYWLQVFESQRFVQNAFVEWQWETCVDEFAMEQGLRGNREWGLSCFTFEDKTFKVHQKI